MPTPRGPGQLALPAAVVPGHPHPAALLPAVTRGHVPPHLNVPQGAAAALMVCASGESTRHSYRPRGKWCSQDTHSTPWPQTRALPVVLQQTNQSVMLTSEDFLGPLAHNGGLWVGAAFPRQPQPPAQLCSLSPTGSQDLGAARTAQIGPSLDHSYFPRTEDNGPSATSRQQHLRCPTASVTLLAVSSPGPAHASAVSAHPGAPGVTGCGVEGGAVWVSVLRNKQKID